jgi:signal transduction histidine kinase/ActR/RegA family two-component response regulator
MQFETKTPNSLEWILISLARSRQGMRVAVLRDVKCGVPASVVASSTTGENWIGALIEEYNEGVRRFLTKNGPGVPVPSNEWLDLPGGVRSALGLAGLSWIVVMPIVGSVEAEFITVLAGVGPVPESVVLNRQVAPAVHLMSLVLSPGAISAGRDEITESLRAELERVTASRDEMIRAGHSRDGFLARISHDLRTPLTSILALVELDREWNGGLSGSVRKGWIQAIADSCHYQLELINDLLDLSKAAAGQLRFTCIPCDANEIAAECFGLVGPQAERRGLRMLLEPSAERLHVRADPKRLKQVLMNLLSNAIKFTPVGGEVRLRVSMTRRGWCELSVRDTGIGIDEAHLSDLFKPYTQVEDSTSTSTSGSGLGLAIAKQFTEAQNGRIVATSQPGQGSEFVVEIPAVLESPLDEAAGAPVLHTAKAASPSAEPGLLTRAVPRDACAPIRVLVVDDHDLNRELVTDYLTAAGFEVHACVDGMSALDVLSNLLPDVLIMDVQMPGLDGLEVTRRVRQSKDPRLAKVPILGLTALAMPEDRARCLEAGMNEYQGKPFSLKTLPGILRRLIEAQAGV